MGAYMKQIKILGSGCAKCDKLFDLTEKAANELGIEYQIEKVKELSRFAEFGVMITPALVVDNQVKVSGKVPSIDVLKNLIS